MILFSVYITSLPRYEFVLGVIINPITLFAIFALVCLALWHDTRDAENEGMRSKIVASVLSLVGFGFVAMYVVVYYIFAMPLYKDQNTAIQESVTGSAIAGIPYKNTGFNFALTFPTDEVLYEQGG